MFILRTISCFFLIVLLVASGIGLKASEPYVRPADFSEETWNELFPYFLPEDSPLKKELDHIFKKRRVLRSKDAMRKSGFLPIVRGEKIVVARHYRLRGYLVKAYLDRPADHELAKTSEEQSWKRRCDGAKIIQDSINRHGYHHLMKVPKKWIYPLPDKHGIKEGYVGSRFILLVEDMEPLSSLKNKKAYRERVTPEFLDAFFTITRENRLYDSFHLSNVPFCKDGRIAFLDTEVVNYYLFPLPYYVFKRPLSDEMEAYWDLLIANDGPPSKT